jgi:Photosynthetic reaction centre cytochrome C subunit
MKKLITVFIITSGMTVLVSSFNNSETTRQSIGQQSNQDSLEKDRAKYVAQIMETIKGKENMRADSVFKNIKMLKIPAARLLKVMELGYSRSLGVSCGHCHNTADFSSEEKEQKEITRQMAAMSNKINTELLKNIQGLKSSPPIINCTTCHRGELKPALNLQ